MQSLKNLKGAVEALRVYQNFIKAGMTVEKVSEIAKSQSNLPPSTYERLQEAVDEKTKTPLYADLVELANQLGIIGRASSKRSSSSGDGKGSTNFALIQASYPEQAAVIGAALKVISEAKGFKVTRDDGTEDTITVQVAFKSANAPKRAEKTEPAPVKL